MKIITILYILLFLFSCGYPDVDNVPDFKNIPLTDKEISDFCSNTYSVKKNIDNCINDYKSRK